VSPPFAGRGESIVIGDNGGPATRRFADPFPSLADPPIRRFADPFLPASGLIGCALLPIAV